MKRLLIIILSISLLINIAYAKRTAMLVGIQNYDAFAPLESCHGDVEDMRELLMQGGFEDDFIWSLKDNDYGEFITASKLFSSVTAFVRGINEGDEVIFFFSGHGIGGSDGSNYLLGADGNLDNPEKYGSISVEEIKNIIKKKKPSEVILIIDACRNFIKKEGKGTGNSVASNMNIAKGIKVEATIGSNPKKKSDKTIVKTIYAASEGQQSYERKDKNNGAFTYYMTYLLDSPNSAMDIDISKDGVITLEDLIQFADNRLNNWTNSQGLPTMNPVYQAEGAITYDPFMLFRYEAERVVEDQKKEGTKPIFEYDTEAELAKIKKFTENKQYLKEQLPIYKPKAIKEKKIEVDNTDLSSWELALVQEQEIKEAKEKENRKVREAKEKQKMYNDLKGKYNKEVADLENTENIFVKYEKLENLRNEINTVKYPEIKHKLLPLLEPIYQKIKDTKDVTQSEVENLKPKFEKDIADMEKMMRSELSDELKKKYLDEFRKKWDEYAEIQKDDSLKISYNRFFLEKEIMSKKGKINFTLVLGDEFIFSRNNSKVRVDDFYISKYEITQSQWNTIVGKSFDEYLNFVNEEKNYPFYSATWFHAITFCNKLSEKEGLTPCYSLKGSTQINSWGSIPQSNYKKWRDIECNWEANGFRLPTEAEWEFASNGGKKSKGYKYCGSNVLEEVAWIKNNAGFSTKKVGLKKPNELGIYDMNGNVWEWCWDMYFHYYDYDESNYYKNIPYSNPKGPVEQYNRHIIRGNSISYEVYEEGSEGYDRWLFLSASDSDAYTGTGGRDCGFRIVRNAE